MIYDFLDNGKTFNPLPKPQNFRLVLIQSSCISVAKRRCLKEIILVLTVYFLLIPVFFVLIFLKLSSTVWLNSRLSGKGSQGGNPGINCLLSPNPSFFFFF